MEGEHAKAGSFDLDRRRMHIQRDVSNKEFLPHYWIDVLNLALHRSEGIQLPGLRV